MLSRRQFLMASTAAAAATLLGGCYSADRLPAERAVAFDYDDVITTDPQWSSYGEHLVQANANTINLGIGRPDWLAFDWSDVPDASAPLVQETGNDFLEQALVGLEPLFPDGYQLSLTIDALIPTWIAADQTLAGTTTTGSRSTNHASVTALTTGAVAERLTKLVTLLCQRYEPHRIALTQLAFDNATFGADDLASYRTTIGVGDWPRRNDGSIDENHATIGKWRSTALATLLTRLKAEAHRFNDTQLDIEVHTNWGDNVRGVPMVGHDYDTLLTGADRIIVSNFFGINDESPTYSGKIAKSLGRKYPERFTICSGLWTKQAEQPVSPKDLELSLSSSAKAGAHSVAVTPAKLLTPGHWSVLGKTWAET